MTEAVIVLDPAFAVGKTDPRHGSARIVERVPLRMPDRESLIRARGDCQGPGSNDGKPETKRRISAW